MSGFTKLSEWQHQAVCNALRNNLHVGRENVKAAYPVALGTAYRQELDRVEQLIGEIEAQGLWFGEQKGVTII